jgi:CRP-like cAMP-binding protein
MEIMATGQVFAHLAALFLVAAALQRRPRIIRLLTTLAGIAALTHFVLDRSGYAWLLWAGLFTAINAVHYAALAIRARTGKLLEEERELFDEVMKIGEPGQQRHLRDLIDWRDVAAGEALVSQGQPHPPLVYVARGRAEIEVDGKRVGECAPGDFLGEMSLISGQTATATVTAAEPMRVARFDREALAQLARAAPEVGRALDSALNRSLAAKMLRMNEVAATRGEPAAH